MPPFDCDSQEGVEPVEVEVERIGGDLVTRSVQFVVEPDGATEFFGAPSALVFEPGVRSRKATILARGDGVPEVRGVQENSSKGGGKNNLSRCTR